MIRRFDLSLLLILAVSSLAPGHAGAQRPAGPCVRLGILGEFSRFSGSPHQPFGDEIRRGAELAAGRACVRYEFIDIENSVSNVGGAILKSARLGTRYFVGLGTSEQALAAVDALYRTGSILISPTSSATALARFERIIRLYPSNAEIAEVVAKAMRRRGVTRLASIFASNSTYSRDMHAAFRRSFARLGGRVSEIKIRGGRFEVAPILRRLRAAPAEGVFLPLFELDAAKIVSVLTQNHRGLWLAGSDAWGTHSDVMVRLLGHLRPKAVVPVVYDQSSPRPTNRAFVRRYVARYGRRPTDLAAFSYDAIKLVARMAASCGSEDVIPAVCLRKVPSVPGTMTTMHPARGSFSPAVRIRSFVAAGG